MEDFEDPDVEAQMAQMMGFSTFGTKPDAKKQKTAQDTSVAATSSNAVPLGQNGMQRRTLTHIPVHTKQEPGITAAADASTSPTTEHSKSAFPTGVPMEIFDKLTWTELEAYRKGVKQGNGDLAWFLPSFIEDPWAKLEKIDVSGPTGS
jgi:hypothetical protein